MKKKNIYVQFVILLIGIPEVNKKNALNKKLFPKDDEISESFKKIKKERNFSKLTILN